MRRGVTKLTTVVAVLLLAAPLAAEAQQGEKKLVRIGYLGNAAGPSAVWDSFVSELRKRGWNEGQNVVFERRFSEGQAERFPELAQELVRLRMDVIVTAFTPAVHAGKQATSTIPIVMAGAGDPTGLIASLGRPGGNVTGVTALTLELGPKLLELFKELTPKGARVAYVLQGTLVHRERLWQEMEMGARALGVKLIPVIVQGPEDFTRGLEAMLKERPDGVVVHGGPLVLRHMADLIAFMAKHKLPAVYDNSVFVRRGGLIGYGASFPDMFLRAATYVDKILKGAKPADLPVEQPTKFELVINLKAAKALNLTIPPSLLVRADQVIE